MADVTLANRVLGTQPDWVALEMEQGGAPPTRLHGNCEGGFGMMVVGAGYHEAFDAAIVAGRGLQSGDADASNRPAVVNEAFVREVGTNPVGARVRKLPRGDEREPGPWSGIRWRGHRCEIRRRRRRWDGSHLLAQRPRRSWIPSWSLCAWRGTHRRLRRASPSLREGSMQACSSGISSPSRRPSPKSKGSKAFSTVVFGSVLVGAVVFSAAGLYALMAVAVQRRTRDRHPDRTRRQPRRVLRRFRPCRSSARRRHHRRQ